MFTQIKKAIITAIWKNYYDYIEKCLWQGDDINFDNKTGILAGCKKE